MLCLQCGRAGAIDGIRVVESQQVERRVDMELPDAVRVSLMDCFVLLLPDARRWARKWCRYKIYSKRVGGKLTQTCVPWELPQGWTVDDAVDEIIAQAVVLYPRLWDKFPHEDNARLVAMSVKGAAAAFSRGKRLASKSQRSDIVLLLKRCSESKLWEMEDHRSPLVQPVGGGWYHEHIVERIRDSDCQSLAVVLLAGGSVRDFAKICERSAAWGYGVLKKLRNELELMRILLPDPQPADAVGDEWKFRSPPFRDEAVSKKWESAEIL